MFDPTVFDNLKVVLEGLMYEHDLKGKILVTGRRDLVDLASMSRTFSIRFIERAVDGRPPGQQTAAETVAEPSVPYWISEQAFGRSNRRGAEAEIVLHADLHDLAGELLKGQLSDEPVASAKFPKADGESDAPDIPPSTTYGCSIWIVFCAYVDSVQKCGEMTAELKNLWGERITVMSRITCESGKETELLWTTVLDFKRKINENQIEDFETLADFTMRSLTRLNELAGSPQPG